LEAKKYGTIVPASKRAKILLARLIFWFLGRGFQAAASLDRGIREELAGWPEITLVMKVQPFGPCLVMAKRGGRMVYLGSRETGADFTVYFKNLESALLVLTGRTGIAQAYAEHRMAMKGDLFAYGMPLVRSLYLVEAYLFPAFITRKILKRMPSKERSSLRVYLKTLLSI